MEVFGGELCVVEEGGSVEGLAGLDAALDPELGAAMVLPVGEEADGVAGGEDVVEVVLELGEGEVGVDGLGDLVGGFEVEGDAGDDADAAEMDDGAEEGVAVVGAGEGVEGAVGGDELDGGDGGGEVLVVDAGAMGSGGGGSGNGDMGEGGEVVEGEALASMMGARSP